MKAELWLIAVLAGVGAGGCMMEVGEPGIDGVYEDEVAVSTSALSSISTRATVTASRFLGFGSNFAGFYTQHGENCMPPSELIAVTSLGFDQVFDVCRSINLSAADDYDGLFFTDNVNDDIVEFAANEERKLADTSGNARGIFIDATNVYWADDSGIHKVPRNGGAATSLALDPSDTLLGLNGSTLYLSRPGLNNAKTLRRMSTAGGASTAIITYTSTTGFKDFSVDNSAMYWVDNTQATNRVRRLSHALGAAMTTVISDDQNTYSHPTPTSNGLHFVEYNHDGFGGIKIRRWLNGVFTDQYTTLVDILGMRVMGTKLYWVEDWPSYFTVKRGTL